MIHQSTANEQLMAILGERFKASDGKASVSPQVATQLRAAGLISDSPTFRYTWANWDDTRNDPVVLDDQDPTVAQVVFSWAVEVTPDRKSDIWLVGPPGMGKDHLATVVAVALAIRWEWTALRCDWMTLTEELKPGGNERTTLEPYKHCDVLIVSDPDRPDQTLFKNKKLGELVRAREHRVTIWTSNTPVQTFCQRIRTSCRRDERRGFNGVGTMLSVKMEESAATIESRLLGRVATEVPFHSCHGDWRKQRYEHSERTALQYGR